jgi:hypothetical protein
MTSNLGRTYAIVAAMIVFFLTWAVVAARPWVEPSSIKTDPRIAALDARERRLRAESVRIKAIVDRRWALYRTALAKRKRQIKAREKAQKALAARQAQIAAQAQALAPAPVPSYSAPVIRVAPPTAPPATQTRTW